MGVINERMTFDTYNDFYLRRKIIKRLFDDLDRCDKEVYKYYVYANRILSDTKVDRIWEFLTSMDGDELFINEGKLRQYYNKGGGSVEYRR